LKSFDYDGLDLAYKQDDHIINLAEILLLDTYRSDLVKKDDTVIDLGAGIGDFSVLASRKVGPNGKVIALEPNVEDYEMLEMNIERNGCENIIALNIGITEEHGRKEISLGQKVQVYGRHSGERNGASRNKKIDFVKMDIEGFEFEVIKKQHRDDRASRCHFH
jgi:23S rRNA U2552 (ribose-2'-O)-methylase RlmE/FtsJ